MLKISKFAAFIECPKAIINCFSFREALTSDLPTRGFAYDPWTSLRLFDAFNN